MLRREWRHLEDCSGPSTSSGLAYQCGCVHDWWELSRAECGHMNQTVSQLVMSWHGRKRTWTSALVHVLKDLKTSLIGEIHPDSGMAGMSGSSPYAVLGTREFSRVRKFDMEERRRRILGNSKYDIARNGRLKKSSLWRKLKKFSSRQLYPSIATFLFLEWLWIS